MDVSLVLITVLLEVKIESSVRQSMQSVESARPYLQVPEVYIVSQAVVVDVEQPVLIHDVSVEKYGRPCHNETQS